MRIVAAILLFALLSPVFAPLAALASGKGPAADAFCTLDKKECMKGDVCMMKERGGKACRMHGGKEASVHEGHGHGHDEAPRCATFYRCGTDDSDALAFNIFETPFLLSTNPFAAAFSSARLLSAAEPRYADSFAALPERPPSASPFSL